MLLGQAQYVLIIRLVMPAAAFLLLIIIGQHSDRLLGEYALVTTFYFVMQTLPLLGLTPFVMREIARQPATAGAHFMTIGQFTLLVGVLVNIGAYAMLTVMPYPDTVVLGIQVVGYSIFGGILAFLGEIILITLHRARLVAITTVVENLLRLLLSIIALRHGADVVELMWVVFGTRLIALAVYAIALGRSHTLPLRPDWSILARVRVVLPVFAVSAVLFLIVSRLDYFVLSWFGSIEQMGYYAIAFRLFEIAMLAAAAITMAAMPRLARQFSEAPASFARSARQLAHGMLALLIPLAIFGYLFAEEYVLLLFGNQYPHPVLLAQLFILLLPLAGIDALASTMLNAADQQNRDLKALFLGALVYAAALLMLVPSLLGIGAFIALLLATLAQATHRITMLNRLTGGILGWPRILAYLISGVILFLIADALDRTYGLLGDLIACLVLLFVYPLMLALLGLFKPLQLLAQFWRDETPRPAHTLKGLMDHMAEDTRQRQAWLTSSQPTPPAYDNLGGMAVALYRLARLAYLNGHRRFARLLWHANLSLTKADIAPESDIGPGLVLPHPAGVILSGSIGQRARFDAWSGVGMRGSHDIGAGPGVPVIEDDVIVTTRSGALGGMRIARGTHFAPHCLALRPADIRHMPATRA